MIRALGCALILGLGLAWPAHAEPATDAVYGDGMVYEMDRDGRHLRYTTRQHEADALVLSSGALATSDAFYVFNAQTADRPFEPGEYRVVLTLTTDDQADVRVAYARVVLGDGEAVRWEPATKFSVQSGVATFADEQAMAFAAQNYEPYGNAVLEALTAAVNQDEYWTAVVVDPETGADAVVFASGYGDGEYTAYWGFDENDLPVALVADFNVLAP